MVAMLAVGVIGCTPTKSATSLPAVTGSAAPETTPATDAPQTTGADAVVNPDNQNDQNPEIVDADTSLEDIKHSGKLVLGLDDSFPPMGFDDNGVIKGFDIDLAKEVTTRMGVDLELQPIDWNAKEMELSSKNIDCIWNGLSVTPDREANLSLSKPYMNNAQGIVVKNGSAIKTKADLAGKSVGIQSASSAMEAVDKEPDVKATFELIEMKDNVLALTELKGGTVDAVVADTVLIQYYTSKDVDSFVILDENFGTEQFAIGFRKQDKALTDEVNKIMDEMIADGTFAKISNTWFGRDVSVKPTTATEAGPAQTPATSAAAQ